jgi:LysM repeat protein
VLPAQGQEATTTHVVQAGENLYRIAQRYGLSTEALAQANQISDPGQIYVGQVLTLPLAMGGGEEPAQNLAGVPADVAPFIIPPSNTASSTGGNFSAAPPPPPPPLSTSTAAASQSPAQNTTNAEGDYVVHIVQANEGLASIAVQYGVSWVKIVEVNQIRNPNIIYPGQQLRIPSPTLTPPADYGQPAPSDAGNRRIEVHLSAQVIRAYENEVLMREVIVSTGLPATPTVQGDFSVYSKLPSQTMSGPGYFLPGVPWVMYFYQGYAIHGTYWHNNFGQPMSHGCVNLPSEEAAWFYEFASVGTPVKVIP